MINILQHLDVWTSAVETRSTAGRGSSNKLNLYGIKKLRELILELAVRGQLVPQNPDDEPASVLLEKIAAEKARLIKDGKLKKQEPLPPITDCRVPYDHIPLRSYPLFKARYILEAMLSAHGYPTERT